MSLQHGLSTVAQSSHPLILHKITQMRKVRMRIGSLVEWCAMSPSFAAHIGKQPPQISQPAYEGGFHLLMLRSDRRSPAHALHRANNGGRGEGGEAR